MLKNIPPFFVIPDKYPHSGKVTRYHPPSISKVFTQRREIRTPLGFRKQFTLSQGNKTSTKGDDSRYFSWSFIVKEDDTGILFHRFHTCENIYNWRHENIFYFVKFHPFPAAMNDSKSRTHKFPVPASWKLRFARASSNTGAMPQGNKWKIREK